MFFGQSWTMEKAEAALPQATGAATVDSARGLAHGSWRRPKAREKPVPPGMEGAIDPSSPQRPLRSGLVTPAWPEVRTQNVDATAASHIAAGPERSEHDVTIIARGWMESARPA